MSNYSKAESCRQNQSMILRIFNEDSRKSFKDQNRHLLKKFPQVLESCKHRLRFKMFMEAEFWESLLTIYE